MNEYAKRRVTHGGIIIILKTRVASFVSYAFYGKVRNYSQNVFAVTALIFLSQVFEHILIMQSGTIEVISYAASSSVMLIL